MDVKASRASEYTDAAERIRATVKSLYWDAKRGLFADTSKHDVFSQHTNALAVLAGVATGAEARTLMERTLAATDLAPASVYFRYYLHAAMVQAGLGDRYLEMLAPWKAMLKQGVTTWPEIFSSRVVPHGTWHRLGGAGISPGADPPALGRADEGQRRDPASQGGDFGVVGIARRQTQR
jgi:hypothetical protein